MEASPRSEEQRWECRRAELREVLPLRARVLIAGTVRVAPDFEGDRDPGTRHYGLFDSGRLRCCLSLIRSEAEGRPAWQLRGMATEPGWRGRGMGRALLRHVEAELCSCGPRRFWCNARREAVGFYEAMGWRGVSEEFLIEGVGPHRRMVRELDPPGGGAPPSGGAPGRAG